jgi:hypothetical protein
MIDGSNEREQEMCSFESFSQRKRFSLGLAVSKLVQIIHSTTPGRGGLGQRANSVKVPRQTQQARN